MNHQTGCLVCGKDLEYLDRKKNMTCHFCEKEVRSSVHCLEGHFVCDRCHSSDANEIIEWFCRKTDWKDPYRIALALMDNQKVKMHGPEHHFLVPAALTAAYYNQIGKPSLRSDMVKIARMRAERVPGGFCGSHGNCGAAVGTGIFISLITHNTPLGVEEWRLSNLMTANSLERIANSGGPRCCKRDSFIAIRKAMEFMEEHFDLRMEGDHNVSCHFSILNKQCKHESCSFYDNMHR